MSKTALVIEPDAYRISSRYMLLKNLYISILFLMTINAVAFSGDKTPALYIASGVGIMVNTEETNLSQTDGLKIVVVTHGWIEREPWPGDLALAIRNRVDANEWFCGWFDWHNEARVINPRDAAQYAHDKAGAILAGQILKISKNPGHVHLIGHSAGCWVISEAAKIIAKKTTANIHLTFLDAYVPIGWDQNELGNVAVEPNRIYWSDHYLTQDITFKVTNCLLNHAHNVDIGDITPGVKDHRFPFHWYPATVLGKYASKDKYAGKKLYCKSGDIEYGFARSLEAGKNNWQESINLPMGNIPVGINKPKEAFDLFRWLSGKQ